MLNTIRLNHTVWYSKQDKIIRLKLSEDIMPVSSISYTYDGENTGVVQNILKCHSLHYEVITYGNFEPELNDSDGLLFNLPTIKTKDTWETRTNVEWNDKYKSLDITLHAHKKFNNDGELVLNIKFLIWNGPEKEFTTDESNYNNKKIELNVIIPFRSHENEFTFYGSQQYKYGLNNVTRFAIRDDKTINSLDIDGHNVVYEAEIIEKDITDEFATYDDVKKMIGELSASNNTNENSDVYTIELEGDDLVLTKENDKSFRRVINLAKYHDEATGQPVNVEALKRDILSIVDGKLPQAETIKQEILADVNPRIPNKESLKNEILAAMPEPSTTPYTLTADKMTGALNGPERDTLGFIDSIVYYLMYHSNLHFEKTDNGYEVKYTFNEQNGKINSYTDPYVKLLTIPFSSLREIPSTTTGGSIDTIDTDFINKLYTYISQHLSDDVVNNLRNVIKSPISLSEIANLTENEPFSLEKFEQLEKIKTNLDIKQWNPTSIANGLMTDNEAEYDDSREKLITKLLDNYYNNDQYYTEHPEELENGFGNKLINHTTNILEKITKDAEDREKAGKLFQKLLDAETLNVVEKADGYELSYTGDVNKVLAKIPKQAVTVGQEAITAALTENVVTESIKPTLDKSYYSKQEVDQMIQQLRQELTAGTHTEEHPQQ